MLTVFILSTVALICWAIALGILVYGYVKKVILHNPELDQPSEPFDIPKFVKHYITLVVSAFITGVVWVISGVHLLVNYL